MRELHEALEPETDFDRFSLEMHGPIYVLEAGVDTLTSLRKRGLLPDEGVMESFQPDWVEKVDLGDRLELIITINNNKQSLCTTAKKEL